MAINAGDRLEVERLRIGLNVADLWLSYLGQIGTVPSGRR
jgi:hypothetical protein